MRSVVLFSLTIFCIAVQAWLLLVALSGLIPPVNTLSIIFPEWQHEVRPERDALLFHCFVGLALLGQAVGIGLFRKKLQEESFIKALTLFLAVELLWTSLMLSAWFKVIVFHHSPRLAEQAFVVLAAGALLSKIFWPELSHIGRKVYENILDWRFDWKADILTCCLIFLILYVPHTEPVLARMFFGDYFHHFDSFLAPAWAFHKGAVLNVDVMSEYGIGIPVIIAWLARLTGGLSYAHMLGLLMAGTIIYFILGFIFLRRWLGSFALAFVTILLAVKFQIFHYTNAPFVFTFPSHTVIRYFWDIIFFLLIGEHVRSSQRRYLWAAAFCCGLQIFCMPTSGYCLSIAFLAYLIFLTIQDFKDILFHAVYILAVPLTYLAFLGFIQGSHLWTAEFWSNMKEFEHYFLTGFGLMPIYENFQDKEILTGAVSLLIPLVYMASFLVSAGLLFYRLVEKEYALTLVLSIYGLAMYHYFMGRSGEDDFYTVSVPYVFLLGFWAKQGLGFLSQQRRRQTLMIMAGTLSFVFISSHMFLSYPNLINISRNPIVDPRLVLPLKDGTSYFNASISKVTEAEKLPLNSLGEKDEGIRHENDFSTDAELENYYDQESDFSKDAQLIDSLTKPSEAVALLSGFEIKMLMQADRRQLFYYSPIIITRPMRMRTFPISAMYSTGHVQRTLNQLDQVKPEYIFMEKIFLQAPGTKIFKDASLGAVLNYIFSNYTPDVQGQYLVAFKRVK